MQHDSDWAGSEIDRRSTSGIRVSIRGWKLFSSSTTNTSTTVQGIGPGSDLGLGSGFGGKGGKVNINLLDSGKLLNLNVSSGLVL